MLLQDTQFMEGHLRTLDWMKRWIILGLIVLLLGCATSEDVRILDGDIRRFQSQLNLIQKEGDTLKKELAALQEKSQEDISALQTETKKLQADLLLQIEGLQSEIRTLSTGIEEYKEFLQRPTKEIDRLKEDVILKTKTLEDKTNALGETIKGIEDRLKGLEEKMTKLVSKLGEVEKPPPTKEVPAEVEGVSISVGDLYKDAYETFQKGNLEGARTKFEAFLKQYPNAELSDNAQFWIGETYYLKKNFEKAILEYEKAIVKYPEGDKIPAALFKQALAFLELGDKTNGRNLLKRVIERYPHSEQAEMAKKRLEGIK